MAKNKVKLSPEARRKALRRLLRYSRPLIPIAAGAFVLAGISIVAAHFIPVLVGNAIDLAVGKGNVDISGILGILTVIPILAIVSALFDWLVRLAGLRLGASVTRDIRADCIRKIEKLPLSYLDSHRTGDTLSRMIADVDRMSEGLVTGITELYSSALSIIVTLIFMIVINYKVALVVALLTPLSMLVAAFISKRTFSLFHEQSTLAARETAVIDESVSGGAVVKAYSREDAITADFDELNEEYRKTGDARGILLFDNEPVNAVRKLSRLLRGCACRRTDGGCESARHGRSDFNAALLRAQLRKAVQRAFRTL